LPGNQKEDSSHSKYADGNDSPEGSAPAVGLAEGCACGNPEDVCKSEAGEHQGDGLRTLVARDEVGCDDAANAEEGPMAESGEDAGGEEEIVGRGDGAGEVAKGEDAHQEQKRQLALELCCGDGDDGRADGDRERVASDEDASLGDADVEVVGQIREQAHDDELGGADAEGGYGECHQRRVQQDMFAFVACARDCHCSIAP